MSCLICRYYQPTEPLAHKVEREADRCEAHCGKKWNNFTAVNYVKEHDEPLQGWCCLHPEPKPFAYNHFCGQIKVFDYFYNHHWRVEKFDEDVHLSLFEWAQKALTTVLHGDNEQQWSNDLFEENKRLRSRLKRVRAISASRLERLQKTQEKEPGRKPKFIPHLIAAE